VFWDGSPSAPATFHHPLLDQRGDEHLVIALVTADKGLCGGFNTTLLRRLNSFFASTRKEH
jgi:F0F1-type ATP synthase gamma subunit